MSKKILVHVCCAPCFCYPAEKLKENDFTIYPYWYNPNIHGWREYNKRRMALGYYLNTLNLEFLREEDYFPEEWFKNIGSYEKENRCRDCYRQRLQRTAEEAKNLGIGLFTTTLLYSRFQNFELIVKEGEMAAGKKGVEFYARDFRKGWKKGLKISKNEKLYRQEYCGCIFSEKERYR